MELADVMDSKSIVGDNVPVRVRPPVLIQNISSVSENKNRLEYASLFLFAAYEIFGCGSLVTRVMQGGEERNCFVCCWNNYCICENAQQ